MLYGYIRVSEIGSDVEIQSRQLLKYGCERLYTDLSKEGRSSQDGLQELLTALQKGDTLVITELDRLGGSLRSLIALLTQLIEQGIHFSSLTENIHIDETDKKMLKPLFQALQHFENQRIKERNKVGLSAARARGRLGGRPRVLDDKKAAMAKNLFHDQKYTVEDICELMKISRATFYRYLKAK